MYDSTFLIVQVLDGVTMLMLPEGSEVNPIAAQSPFLAILLKIVVILFFINGSFGKYESIVVLVGIVVGSLGFGANLSVLV